MNIKNAGLILLVVLGGACQKRTPLHSLSWQENEPPQDLLPISSIPTATENPGLIYKNNRFEYQQQLFNQQRIEETFVKKVYKNSADIKLAQAKYIITDELKAKNFLPVQNETPALVDQLTKLVAPLNIRHFETESVLRLVNSKLISQQAIQYELSDGSLWKAYFNKNKKFSFKKRLGSQFSDAHAQVYPKGPRQSTLTEVILKELEFNPSISNASVFVDSESSSKITSSVPQLKFETKDDRFDQVQVFFYLDYILGWMKDHLAVTFPNQLQAVVSVGYPDLTNTSFYYQNKIRFGRGDNVDYSMLAADPSIVFHESFHALIDGLAHLPFEGEGGSMNEGFADFFTCVVLDRPFLGESAYLKAPYKRTVQADIKLNEMNGGLYHDSQIISSLLWEMKEKLGAEKALAIATDTLSKLNPASQFSDFNEQILKVTPPGDLNTVSNILKTRGFIYE